MALCKMQDLLEAGIHFGHQTRRWNPKMKRFIFGQRNGIYIIDLQQTMRQLYKAYGLVRDTVAAGGTILFVGTKKQSKEAVQREAERCGMYYVNNRWLGGTLTNWETIRQSIKQLLSLEKMIESGEVEKYTKKEGIQIAKQRDRLDKNLCGIKSMQRPPQLMFVIDTKKEAIAVNEANRLGIPCIGVVDTNADPDTVPVPIPGNDDAIRSVNLFCHVMAEAVLEGRMKAEKVQADEFARQQEKAGVAEKIAAEEAEEAGEEVETAAEAEAKE